MMEQAKQAEEAQHVKTAGVIATFAKRAKEEALAARASPKDAEIAAITAQQMPQHHLRMLQLCKHKQSQFEQTTYYKHITDVAA